MKIVKTDTVTNLNPEFLAPLLGLSMQEVFSLMLGAELTPITDPPSDQGFDVTAMVGLAGSMCGLLTLRCHSKSAALMASKMLGINEETAGPEVLDAIGEVCNMVAGNFKNKIAGMGDGCKLSVPTVITGGDYVLHALAEDSKIEVNLLFDRLPLIVSLKLNS